MTHAKMHGSINTQKMAQNMQIGICVKLHNYLIQAVKVQYHNFCTVCALRMQFVHMEVD